MNNTEALSMQQSLCKERHVACVPSEMDSKLGYATGTQGKLPINGLRHPLEGGTNGWYIWCGENLPTDPDFFSPLHTVHLVERCPDVLPYLGLPPGSRFLLAGDFVDIWFDESLLNID